MVSMVVVVVVWQPQVQQGIAMVLMVVAVVMVWNGEAKSVTVAAPKPPRYTTSLLMLSHVITCSLCYIKI